VSESDVVQVFEEDDAEYPHRSNMASCFVSCRGRSKFGDPLKSKSATEQMSEFMCPVICHDQCVPISCIHEIGLNVPTFGEQPAIAG